MTASAAIAHFPAGLGSTQLVQHHSPSQASAEDVRFDSVLRASRAFGGLAREGEVLLRLAGRCVDAAGRIDEWIERREGIHFRWNAAEWWPMFQFDATMSLRWHVARVATELRLVFDDWAIAEWFVEPNRWTDSRPPLDLIVSEWSSVLEAARADRFLVAG